MSINIYTKRGDKVVFANPNAGYETDQKHAKNFLKEGEVYTVKLMDVGNWRTGVSLEEVPFTSFNSVLFEDYKQED